MHKTRFVLFVLTVCLFSCKTSQKISSVSVNDHHTVLDSILNNNTELNNFISRKDSLRIQIIYTQIDRDENNQPHFTQYSFNVNKNLYFYPASTVKMPTALLALERLNKLNIPGLDKNSTMKIDSSYLYPAIQTSVANCVKRIFLVSDNDAFNHLYEFLGQQYINQQLHHKGYLEAEIRHRLQIFLTPEQNRQTDEVNFFDPTNKLLYHQPAQYSKIKFSKRKDFLGNAHINYNDSFVSKPFDFSLKNRIYLQDLTNILRSVIFPESVAANQRFDLTEDDYKFLYRYMSGYPSESKELNYDTSTYHDTYVKLLLYGSEKIKPASSIRIFNKEGDAYGFLTDVAYIVDFDKKIEFMLSANIFCDTDGVINDDKVEYDSIGYPFMKAIGQAVYQYELQRKRDHVPDLCKFKIDYSFF
jgi:hypothetical protein